MKNQRATATFLSLARSTDDKAEYTVNVKNGELSVKNSDN